VKPSKIFAPTVLRQAEDGQWYLMNGREKGWARSSFGPYMSLDDVRDAWAITIGRAGEDRFSTFREVTPA